ncbi:MAG: LamG domain-containing protein, partial [Flavobacteriales bacterium]
MKKTFLLYIAFVMSLGCLNAQNYTLSLNGTNSYVSLGSTLAGIRTVEVWFKPTSTINSSNATDVQSFIVRNDATQTNEFQLFIGGGSWPAGLWGKIGFASQTGDVYSDNNVWNANQWHHVCGVIDPVSGMKLYIDGILQTDTEPALTSATTVQPEITTIGCWGNSFSRFFNGNLENLRIWNRALSQTEIQNKMCLELNPASEVGLIAAYYFNEGSGAVIQEENNLYDGTNNNSSWTLEANPCDGKVLSFNGASDYVDLGSAISGIRSIEIWFKPTSTVNSSNATDVQSFVVRNDATQTNEFQLFIGGGSWPAGLWGKIGFASQTGDVYSNNNVWNANQWYHVCGVIDPATGMKLYIDGVLQTDTEPALTSATTVQPEIITIGCWGNSFSRFFNGHTNELRIWDRALTQTEIQNKMCTELIAANETGLIAYYKFNEGSGTIIIDETNIYDGDNFGPVWANEPNCVVAVG